jgi:hypothetical protein
MSDRASAVPPAMRLVRDEPAWRYPGIGGPVERRLRVWENADTSVVAAVITEPADAPGTSVTNAAATIYRLLEREYPTARVVLIEDYPHSAARYSLVEGVADGGDPRWRFIDGAAVRAMLPNLEAEKQ